LSAGHRPNSLSALEFLGRSLLVVVVAFALVLGGCASRVRRPARVPVADANRVLVYELTFDEPTGDVLGRATLPPGTNPTLVVADDLVPFVADVRLQGDKAGQGDRAGVTQIDNGFRVPACAKGCVVSYRVRLGQASRRIRDLDTAARLGSVLEAPPSSFLLVPQEGPADATVRFSVVGSPGTSFVTGVRPSPVVAGAYDLRYEDAYNAPYSAFGRMRTLPLRVGATEIQIALAGSFESLADEELKAWVSVCVTSVAQYFGAFPAPRVLALLVAESGQGVNFGKSLSGGGSSVVVFVGRESKPADLALDWVMPHELIHIGFPSQPRNRGWVGEGIATYVEPLARARAGLLSEADVWRGFAQSMFHGLPGDSDQGIDRTRTWGRTYWGGALFFLMADLEIRKRTQGKKSLRDALAGIVARGGTNDVRWDLEDTFDIGDAATGVPVLREQLSAWSETPVQVDLPALYQSLGVSWDGQQLRLSDDAPLSALRRSLTDPAKSSP
jgi:hypothetical protein